MTAISEGNPTPTTRPKYAPVPELSFGPPVNEDGYYVGQVERNLYWVTDGDYNSAFMTTKDGVVVFDAPPSIGHNIRRAVDEVAAATGASTEITHLIYTHHHSDHAGASVIFGKDVVRIGHEETRRLLLRDNDPNKPAPEETFQDRRTLEIGGERIELAWRGSNHTPDNTYIHFPDHDTLMLVDIVSPGWVPFYSVNLSEDLPGWMDAPTKMLDYPWKTLIGGHMGKLGTRDDVKLHQEYVADMAASAKAALGSVDPTPFFTDFGGNNWAAVRGYLDAVTDEAAGPIIEKYRDRLGAADVFTASNTFAILESIRLDLGYRMDIHP
jgi:glyoxylase-like metal-dependent hydrolase (beta-lactamase superfamily II)